MLKDFDELDEASRDRLVGCGIELMAAITDTYGSEEGLASWETLSNHFGNGFKHNVFMAMLTGRTTNHITLRGNKGYRDSGNFIEFIKAIRAIAGHGLKEAKDLADEVSLGMDRGLNVSIGQRREAIERFRQIGISAY